MYGQNRVNMPFSRFAERARRRGHSPLRRVAGPADGFCFLYFAGRPARVYDQLYISNYAILPDEGCHRSTEEWQVFGIWARDYSMRIWSISGSGSGF